MPCIRLLASANNSGINRALKAYSAKQSIDTKQIYCFVIVFVSEKVRKNNMSEADVPCILNGKYFAVTSTHNGIIVAKCINCVNKSLSGTTVATSNFVRHLRVSHIHNTILNSVSVHIF
jgi:hypothetical protein